MQELQSHEWWRKHCDWAFFQAQAHLQKVVPTMCKTVQKYQTHTLVQQFEQDPFLYQLYKIFTTSPRSSIVHNQKSSPFNATVPLVLMVYKKFYNIPYHSWTELHPLLENDHRTVLNNQNLVLPPLSQLSWQTYPQDLTKYNGLGSWESSVIGKLDRLSKHIYLQTWLWHPSIINAYSIQSLENWDRAQVGFHTSHIFK